MFKVICYDANGTKGWLKEGGEYTVVGQDDTTFNLPVYFLAETEDEFKRPWDKNRFIRLPDQTADEIESETKEAIVNLETVPA